MKPYKYLRLFACLIIILDVLFELKVKYKDSLEQLNTSERFKAEVELNMSKLIEQLK